MVTKDFSEALRDTRQKIEEALNASGLPIDAMDLLIGEIKIVVHAQAENAYMALVQQRQQEAAEAAKTKTKVTKEKA